MYRTLLGVSKEFVHIVKAMEQRESTAPCKDVSKEFVLIGCVLRKRSVFILYFTHPHLFNENKLRTHDTTLGQARCGTYLSNENLGFIHANNIPRGLRANKMTSKERVIYAKCKA